MDYAFIDKFYTISERMRRIMAQRVHIHSITKQEFFMMQMIRWLEQEGKKVNTVRLSEALSVSKSAVSQMVNSLEDKCFVKRQLEAEDRRQPSIHLTERGCSMLTQEEASVYNGFFCIFDQLGEEKSNLFLSLLEDFAMLCEACPSDGENHSERHIMNS